MRHILRRPCSGSAYSTSAVADTLVVACQNGAMQSLVPLELLGESGNKYYLKR